MQNNNKVNKTTCQKCFLGAYNKEEEIKFGEAAGKSLGKELVGGSRITIFAKYT